MARVKLTLGQAYLLACCTVSPHGMVATWDDAPSSIDVVMDGKRCMLRDPHFEVKMNANALVTRGLAKARGGSIEITDAGRAALALRPDMLRCLRDLTEARVARERELSDAADAEWYAAERERRAARGGDES